MNRILIIEDNKSQQEVYNYWFADDSLDFCDSIYDAWKLLETKDYDFILLDLYLDDAKESGFYFLEEFKKLKDVKPKVIVVSAYFSSLKEELREAKAQEPAIKEEENVVWLTKEEATKKRLMEETGLKEDGFR